MSPSASGRRKRYEIRISCWGVRPPFSLGKIRAWAVDALSAQRQSAGTEVGIVWVSDRMIRHWNLRHLDHPWATDVIAFPQRETGDGRRGAPNLLGDVMISLDRARLQARQYGQTLERECARLVVHGLLHLMGYRDHTLSAKRKMWQRQEILLKRLL